jgi:hypothetical protein
MNFTFPAIHTYWLIGVWQNLILAGLWLMPISAAFIIGQDQIWDGASAVPLITIFSGVALILSLAGGSEQKKLIPAINERFAVEFMLRTGYPPYPEDVDVLQVQDTVAVRDEEGHIHLWRVRRQRDIFTIEPA